MSDVIRQVIPAERGPRIAVLSGPSFAREVARGDPTAIVIASEDGQLAAEIQEEFSGPTLRLYSNSDVAGVELGGSVKNVIAIAAGVTEGLGLGHNTLAALITRGLAEMSRLAIALGGRPETMAGLAGWATSFSLARAPSAAIAAWEWNWARDGSSMKLSARCAWWRKAYRRPRPRGRWRRRLKIEMPITEQMHAVLYEGRRRATRFAN